MEILIFRSGEIHSLVQIEVPLLTTEKFTVKYSIW